MQRTVNRRESREVSKVSKLNKTYATGHTKMGQNMNEIIREFMKIMEEGEK